MPVSAGGNDLTAGSTTFNLIIHDPCESPLITLAPVSNDEHLTFILDSDTRTTELTYFTVTNTELECILTYTAVSEGTVFDGDGIAVSFTDEQFVFLGSDPDMAAVYSTTVTATTPDGTVLTEQAHKFNVNVLDPCEPPTVELTVPTIADVTYYLQDGALTIDMGAFEVVNKDQSYC